MIDFFFLLLYATLIAETAIQRKGHYMSCTTCNPVNLKDRGFSQGFTQKQPLVLKEGCVAGSTGAIYCLVDNRDGTAYIDASSEGQISAPFAIGYSAEIKATDADADGFERVYVTTGLDEGATYRIDTQIYAKFSASYRDEWKKIRGIKVPYDLDLTFDGDGCNGTDWFFQDDPLEINTVPGGLFVGSYLIAPEIVTYLTGENKYSILRSHPQDVDRVRDILNCALNNTDGEGEATQIRSAIAMLDSAEPSLYVSEGPLKFNHAHIGMSLEGGDVDIRSGRNEDGRVTALHVNISPEGLGNDEKKFDINLLGMTMVYDSNCGKDSCGVPYVGIMSFDASEKMLYLGLLKDALKKADLAQDRETIRQVISVIENPPPRPKWVGWQPGN